MKPPIDDLNKCLAILILGSVGCSDEEIAGILHCAKATVGNVETWFKKLRYQESLSYCHEQAVKNAFWLQIIPSDQALSKDKLARAAQATNDYILMHYGKRHRKQPEQPLLTPSSLQHTIRLSDAAGLLRLNIKEVKQRKRVLVGNIMQGHIASPKASNNRSQIQLKDVDRFDAECLLSHLKVTYPEFEGIENWERVNTREAVYDISGDMMRKLRLIHRGVTPKGTCEICRSWRL
ncbi:hypothetical protein ACFLWS_03815 [Chloroflexota bacterium]